MDVVNRVTVILTDILTGIIDLTTTTTTTIPSIHPITVAIIPCIPITDILIHIIHIMDTTPIMGDIGIDLLDMVTQRHARRLVT